MTVAWITRTAWPALSAALIGAYLVAVLVAGGPVWSILAPGTVVTVTSLVAGVACWLAARRATGADRLGWRLLAAGLWSATVGNALWLYLELTSPGGAPFPSVSEVFVIAMVPLSLAGAAALGGLGRAGVRMVLDGLIISGSLLFLSWCTVLGPLVVSGAPSLVYTVFVFATPLGDIAMASMAFILLVRAGRRHRTVFALVGSGMLAVAVAESGFAYMMQIGAYSAGNVAMNGWLVGYLLIGWGALRSRGATADPVRRTPPIFHALPYVPLVLALIAGVLVDVSRGGIGTFAYLLTIVLVLLVVVRQLVALRDNVLLTRDLRTAMDDLTHLASHDPLTGLPNRALFHRRSDEATLAPVTPLSPAVLYLDLDGFKQVNDVLGHAAGDALLVAVAARLRECVRATDTVARLGGDEFTILITDVASREALQAQADRVVRAIGEPFDLDGTPARVGASVGVAWNSPDARHSGAELLRRADLAMYAAKTRGKSRYACFDATMLDQPQASGSAAVLALQ